MFFFIFEANKRICLVLESSSIPNVDRISLNFIWDIRQKGEEKEKGNSDTSLDEMYLYVTDSCKMSDYQFAWQLAILLTVMAIISIL